MVLDGGHRLDSMGPANIPGASLGKPEVEDFAFRDEVPHGTGHVLDRDVGVDPVL